MTNKSSAVAPGNRVFLADLGTFGTFKLHCAHAELEMLERMLNTDIAKVNFQSVRQIDCGTYCMIFDDAAKKGVKLDKESFKAALDRLPARKYTALMHALAECYAAAFNVPDEEEENADGAGDEKNAESLPDGTGTEAW